MDLIDYSFPEVHFLEQIEILKKKDEENQKIRAKFNGELVMEWSGLKGKELGNVITEYRKEKNEQFFKNTNSDDIKSDFRKWYMNYIKKELNSTLECGLDYQK